MLINAKDFIELDYTGRLAEGPVFDTTIEAVSRQEGLFEERHRYGPVIICVGERHILKGLDDALPGKDVGAYTIPVKDVDGFGKKDPKLLKLIPGSQFLKQRIRPEPGLEVTIDGLHGTVRTVSGGRVIVDFNHPLASKDLVYEVVVRRVVTDPAEKVEAIAKLYHLETTGVAIEGDMAVITPVHEIPGTALKPLTDLILRLTGLKTVQFNAPAHLHEGHTVEDHSNT